MNRLLPCLLVLALTSATLPAAGQCPPFICFLDLGPNPGFICPNRAVYQVSPLEPVNNPLCEANQWSSGLVEVTLPSECSGIDILVEYEGDPADWTINIGDSETNNGFGGDGGSLPTGQNAEIQILDNELRVYGAADAPPVEKLTTQRLQLRDGAVHFVVEKQFLSWGQPYGSLETPNLQHLFFLPDNPVPPENRTLFVGANRVISSTFRNGCGTRRVLMTLR